jgi:predicted nucleotidyltransferase
MRISAEEQKAIRDTALEVFGDDVTITLFGSRVDDTKKGGDIDILIETEDTLEKAFRRKFLFLAKLKQQIGDRKIDVVVRGSDSGNKPIYEVAQSEGVEIK